jgi:hypothetical protein
MHDIFKLDSIEARLSDLKKVFGKPPVLPDSEDAAAYEEMLRRLIGSFAPQDFFETALVKDIADATWEAARCARHKVLLLERKYRDGREAMAKRRKEWAAKKGELAKRVAASQADPKTEPADALDHLIEECDAILIEPATELDHNRVLEATLAQVEKITKLEMMAYAKRDMALRQLDWYREGLGRRLRAVSDELIAEYANGEVALPALTVPSTNPVIPEAASTETASAETASTETASNDTPSAGTVASPETAADAPPVQPQ